MINVLVVEDEILLLRNIKKKILSVSEDFQIIGEAFNGKEALNIIEKNRPDIIFTDIRMPIMDGLELAKIIQEKYPEIYVIIVSGYDDFEYARTAIRYQVHDYLLKPLKMEPLTKLLDSLKATIERDSRQIQSQVFFSSETPIVVPELTEPTASDMMCWSTLNTSAPPEIDSVIKEMDAYIRLHYKESINISQLAEKYHFNHSYMTRTFKKQMGQSPLKLINELRINDAKKMLTDSPLSIREISEQLGFTDQHYFSRIFKDFTGVNPKDFRRNITD